MAFTNPRAFGAALTHLAQETDADVREVAQWADLPPARLLRILNGDTVPPWPIAYMLTMLFGGDPQETRIVWEGAQGISRPARIAAPQARAELHRALRGLRLAARNPSPHALSRSAGVDAVVVEDVFSGRVVPDWPTTAALVSAMGADANLVRAVWELAVNLPRG
ncbi:hypothetical protein ACSNOK_17585 [Streptomyces sp. URMC 126]|uniref:hypothetical protein n=1 Tax=Streptomyces sp. URMC 126 TaxID=3423401 RepID=UPI003F195315